MSGLTLALIIYFSGFFVSYIGARIIYWDDDQEWSDVIFRAKFSLFSWIVIIIFIIEEIERIQIKMHMKRLRESGKKSKFKSPRWL